MTRGGTVYDRFVIPFGSITRFDTVVTRWDTVVTRLDTVITRCLPAVLPLFSLHKPAEPLSAKL